MALLVIFLIMLLISMLALQRVSSHQGATPGCSTALLSLAVFLSDRYTKTDGSLLGKKLLSAHAVN
jgi:hypothetical protein